jgi:hypothetical protein
MNTTRFPSGEYMGLSSRRDEKVNGSGVRLAAASGMRQILVKWTWSENANRLPSPDNEGWSTPRSALATGMGAPPPEPICHRRKSPLRSEENTMCRPSGVQARPDIRRRSKVNRFGSPPFIDCT